MLRIEIRSLPVVDLPSEIAEMPIPEKIGLIEPKEARCLYWAGQQNDGAILEIGCRDGATTFCLAEFFPNRKIYGLDYVLGNTMVPEQQVEFVHDIGKYVLHHPNVEILDINSRELDYSIFSERISMVFIDGDHSYEGVKADTELALNYLQAQNHPFSIVWHDYGLNVASWVKVPEYLHSLGPTLPICYVRDTQIAIMRG